MDGSNTFHVFLIVDLLSFESVILKNISTYRKFL